MVKRQKKRTCITIDVFCMNSYVVEIVSEPYSVQVIRESYNREKFFSKQIHIQLMMLQLRNKYTYNVYSHIKTIKF